MLWASDTWCISSGHRSAGVESPRKLGAHHVIASLHVGSQPMRSYRLGMAGFVVLANLTLLGQSEVWFGTWKLNPAKSAYVTDPSPPPGQHTITRVEPWEGGLMYRTETVTARGEVRHTEWTA